MQPLPSGVKLKDRYRVERALGYGGHRLGFTAAVMKVPVKG